MHDLVPRNLAGACKRLPAFFTFKRFDAGVGPQMLSKVTGRQESLVTVRTVVRPLPDVTVSQQVAFEVKLALAALEADGTLILAVLGGDDVLID